METGRFPLDWFKKGSPLLDALKNRFGRDDLIAVHSHPYLYLNLDAIADANNQYILVIVSGVKPLISNIYKLWMTPKKL